MGGKNVQKQVIGVIKANNGSQAVLPSYAGGSSLTKLTRPKSSFKAPPSTKNGRQSQGKKNPVPKQQAHPAGKKPDQPINDIDDFLNSDRLHRETLGLSYLKSAKN